jgi:hypothetical protein
MVTYKNIRIPKRGGGSRLQRVKVLKSGKYQFVKNLTKGASKPRKSNKKRKRSNPVRSRSVKKVAKGKFFKNMGIQGFAEDLAWGYFGINALAPSMGTASALATTRAIQGIQGYALNRRGKARLMFAITDLIDLWLAGQFNLSKLSGVSQILKISPLQ